MDRSAVEGIYTLIWSLEWLAALEPDGPRYISHNVC
jgi:hypothetical protein